MSFVLLGILNSAAAGGGEKYFLSLLGGASNDFASGLGVDSEGNAYVGGSTQSAGSGSNDAFLVKYNSDGENQWQRAIGTSDFERTKDLVMRGDNEIYLTGFGSGSDLFMTKSSSSGSLSFSKKESAIIGGNTLATDGTSIYLLGESNEIYIAKYNSSGTRLWNRVIDTSTSSEGLAVDSSGNVYVGLSEGSGNKVYFIKLNSSGSIIWQRGFEESGAVKAIATDSSNNMYALIREFISGSALRVVFVLAKYNSSGTLQWQRQLADTRDNYPGDITLDSQDNIYIVGSSIPDNGSDRDITIAKYNSSGTIQWQRDFGSTGDEDGNDGEVRIQTDSNDNLYISSSTDSAGSGNYDFLLLKIPNDGSLTGTYNIDGVDYVYEASSLTDSAFSATSDTSSFTTFVQSTDFTNAGYSNVSASLTEYITEIG